jgi:hypothetical protein
MNITRLRNTIILHIGVENIKHNWRFNFYLYFFEDLVHENFHGSFHMLIDQGTF